MKKKVRIAQIGITSHGETILNAIRKAPSLELVALNDLKDQESRATAKKLGVRHIESYEAIIADSEVDAVALVTPNHLHAAQMALAIDAGKHVFVEKPITRTVAEGKSAIAHAKQKGVVLMVGHNTRRRGMFRKSREVLESGKLGTIAGVEMNMSRPAGLFADLPGWKADPQTAHLVPMTQLGIHFVDVVHYLLGPIRYVGCVANHTSMPGGGLDAASAVFRLESGVPAVLSSYYVTPDVYSFRIYGTKGILSCSVNGVSLQVLKNDKLVTDLEQDFSAEGYASYEEEMEEFGRCVLEGREPETNGEGGVAALAVIEAMTESLKSGRIIDVKEILR
ncbi:MAG: oxidoreductase [Bacteroidia bacterium]|nr:MAG: oxidoreductase [Bacteroidia bacterium]